MKKSKFKKIINFSLSALLLTSNSSVMTLAEDYDERTGTAVVTVEETLPEVGALSLLKVPSFEKFLESTTDFDGKLDTIDYLEVRDTRLVKGDWRLKASATQLADGVTSLGINDFKLTTTKNSMAGLTFTKLKVFSDVSILNTNGALLDANASAMAVNYELALSANDFSGILNHSAWGTVSKGTYTGTITYTIEDSIWGGLKPLLFTDSVIETSTGTYGYQNGILGDKGDNFTFPGAEELGQWRILAVNGDKRLVIKEEALTQSEIESLDETQDDSNGRIKFHDSQTTYFSSDPKSTGYGESKLKRVIDKYYEQYLKPSKADDYILPVDLHLATLADVKSGQGDGIYLKGNSTYDSLEWNGTPHNETDFATTSIGGQQQAFALSYADLKVNGASSHLINMGPYSGQMAQYWLRSLSKDVSNNLVTNSKKGGTVVGNSADSYYSLIVSSYSRVHPALWISIK